MQVSPALLAYLYCVNLGMRAGSLMLRTCQNAGSGPLVVCSLLLSSFSLCLWCVACKYGSISHFKGVFSGFPLLDVGLYCFDALRGLWGFCVREWLGGLKACGVFASIFPLLCLPFHLFTCLLSFILSALLWLSFFVLLHCLSFPALFVVSFSLRLLFEIGRAHV